MTKFTEDASLLTDRTNVICISDEAHRSQVNLDQKVKITDKGVTKTFGFAKYLHDSLPNATFVGFTGTPIDATLDVFGKVVDAYTMTESVKDEITVRIVYEGRAAKVLLNNSKFQEKDYRKELDRQFKNEKSNFKIAIVVDMWLTGFDVPFLDSIYIDKPIQRHNLIQTISCVNRKFEGKNKGLVVDYIGIKNQMNLALKQYSEGDQDNFEDIAESIIIVKNHLDLLAKIDKIKLPNTKIKLLQQLLAKVIGEIKKVNRVKGIDFSKKMQALVERYNNRDANDILRSEVYEEMANALTDLIWEVHKEFSAGDELGIDFEEKAFYDILKELCIKYDFKYPEDKMIDLAKAVKDMVDGQAKFPDWNKRDDIKSALKVGLILLLDEFGYPPVERDEVYVEIFEQAENFKRNQQ